MKTKGMIIMPNEPMFDYLKIQGVICLPFSLCFNCGNLKCPLNFSTKKLKVRAIFSTYIIFF